MKLIRTTIGPLLLMICTPPIIALAWLTCVYYDGSILQLVTKGNLDTILRLWPLPSIAAAKIIGAFVLLETVLMLVLPGKKHLGPVTPSGDRPEYKLNGVPAFLGTIGLLYLGSYQLKWFSPGIVYDHFGEILTTLTLFGLIFCGFLYIKGVYAPSSKDAGRSGNFIFDYYWGVELHPRILGVNIKQLINCRVGMMGWAVIILSFAAKQHEMIGHVADSMIVSVLLQQIYILKFFIWESGYFGSLDIMHDRFGYYICWGVLCWIPGVYTLVAQYLVKHPVEMGWSLAAACTLFGILAIWANYDADAQRQRVRETGGKCSVWGRPPEVILAHYTTTDGEARENLLLASGWWGLARHIHYVSELSLTLAWTLPAGFVNILPYFYFVFLTILLVDRSGRDELRCRKKYGDDWTKYCERVRYRILPLIY